MESVAEEFGSNAIGVLLTGMGQDGMNGMKSIKGNLGRTIAQNEETCSVYGMPRSAVEIKVVDKIVPLNRISREIIRMLKRK
jgi:two-component system chemotaxis response regulator CheB